MRQWTSNLPWILILGAVLFVVLRSRSPDTIDMPPQVSLPEDLSATAASVDTLLVKFGAEWCPPCRRLDTELERIDADAAGNAKIILVDVDHDRVWADAFNVRGIPHMVLFKNGQPVDQKIGYRSAEDVAAWMGLPAPH